MYRSEQAIDPARRRAAILLLSTADWDAPLWTNKQFMACELARAHDVVYVESLGLRRPRVDLVDARRALRRVHRRIRPLTQRAASRPVPESIEVVRPLVAPLHNRATDVVNRRIVQRSASPWTSRPGPRLLWTYSPVTYGLERQALGCVYHAVDLLGAYPGIDDDVVEAGERRLAAAGATAIASSEPVRQHLCGRGFDRVLHWPNVADVEPFAAAAAQGRARGRRVVFGGNLTPHKVDLHMVASLARSHPELEVVLAGPTDEGGGGRWTAVEGLAALGVRLPGRLAPDALAALYATATVGIIPYRDTEYTRGVDPLKLYEYLAAGLSVVATDLPGIRASTTHLRPADVVLADGQSFVQAVVERAGAPSDDDVRRRVRIARDHSWATRGAEARGLVDELITPAEGRP